MLQLPHVELAYNNSVRAATGLAPNEVHMGNFPRLPLTIFRTGVFSHQSLAHDCLAYSDLATDRQQRAYDIVREHHGVTVSRVERRNSALSDALHAVPKFTAGGWVWMYNTSATIRQGANTDTDAEILKAKFSLDRTGPHKVLAVDPCTPADTPDGSPSGDKRLCLDLPSDMPDADARGAVRCNAANLVPTPTTKAICRSIYASRVDAIRAQHLLQDIAPAPRHSRRHFDSTSTTRSGEDKRTPIGSRSRWGHRGDVRDALNGSIWIVQGARNGLSFFATR